MAISQRGYDKMSHDPTEVDVMSEIDKAVDNRDEYWKEIISGMKAEIEDLKGDRERENKKYQKAVRDGKDKAKLQQEAESKLDS